MKSVIETREITILGQTITTRRQYLPGQNFYCQGAKDPSGLSTVSNLTLTAEGKIVSQQTIVSDLTGLVSDRNELSPLPSDIQFSIPGFSLRKTWQLVA